MAVLRRFGVVTHRQPKSKLQGWRSSQVIVSPEVQHKVVTKRQVDKPARITKRQAGPVLALLRRVASGGDATTAVDAATLIPVMERALATAPAGHRAAKCWYSVTTGDGRAERLHGLASVMAATGRARSTVANALTVGHGYAEFAGHDAHGNPAVICVQKLADNGQELSKG